MAIENLLKRDWWGKRDLILPQDEVEEQYAFCYGSALLGAPDIGQEMILRHLPRYREILVEAPEPRDGYLEVPTRPGIGFELNEEFFASRRG